MSVDEEGVGGSVFRGMMSFFAAADADIGGGRSRLQDGGCRLDTRKKDVKEKDK